MRVERLSVLVGLGMLVGCTSLETTARETFSRDHSCPLDGITVTKRTDLSVHELTFGKSKPPADIAKDPERLLIWKKNQDENKKKWDAMSNLFFLTGCNVKSFYTCSRNNKSGRNSCSSLTPREDD